MDKKEKARLYHIEYYKEHGEEINAKRRQWRKEHPILNARLNKKYRDEFKEKHGNRYFLKKKEIGGLAPLRAVRNAVERGNLPSLRVCTIMCVDCKKERATMYDHRNYNFPLWVEPVCNRCNQKRGKALPLIIGGVR